MMRNTFLMACAVFAFSCGATERPPVKLCSTVDILDNCFFTDNPAGYYTKDELRRDVEQAKAAGFRKIYYRVGGGCSTFPSKIRHMYFGEPRWHWAKKLVKTLETYDVLAEYIKVCHELGMEIYYWEAVFDNGGYLRSYPGMKDYERWGEHPSADRLLKLEHHLEHRRNADTPVADLPRPIAKIRLRVLGKAPEGVSDKTLLVYTGAHEKPFARYTKPFRVTVEPAPEGQALVLEGLEIRDPVIKFASDTLAFASHTTDKDDVHAHYADGEEVALFRSVEGTLGGDKDREHMRRGVSGQDISWGKSGDSLFVRFGDFDRYAKGVPEFAYPECRKRLVDLMTELYERYPDLDGVTFSIRTHSLPACGFKEEMGGGDLFYGFCDPVVNDYKKLYGVNPRTESYDKRKFLKIRGKYVTQMLEEVGAVVHRHGGKFEMMAPVDAKVFDGLIPWYYVAASHGSMFPWWRETGIDDFFDIETWAKKGIVDMVMMLGTGYSQKAWNQAWKDEVKRFKAKLAGTKTKLSLHYLVNDRRGEGEIPQTLPGILAEGDLDEVEFYEQKSMINYPEKYAETEKVLKASGRPFAR